MAIPRFYRVVVVVVILPDSYTTHKEYKSIFLKQIDRENVRERINESGIRERESPSINASPSSKLT